MTQLTAPHHMDFSFEAPTEELSGAPEIFYVGKMTPFGPAVFVEEGEIGHPLSLEAARGYSWGTSGSRPVDLSRRILLEATGHERLAEQLSRAFTWEVVGLLPADHFRLGRAEVLAWVEDFGLDEVVASKEAGLGRGRRAHM